MKRIMSILCILCFCFTAIGVNAEEIYSDVSDTRYENAITVLSKLCVLTGDEDGQFRPQELLTRSEYTAAVLRLLGLENVAKVMQGEDVFVDVPKERWDSRYVALAYHLNLVQGNGDNTFEGDANVLFEQAAKILVSALGYADMAEEHGGYPTGYILYTQRLSLLSGISDISAGQEISREIMAQMLYNALEQPILELDPNGNVLNREQTILNSRLGVEKKRGVVTANEFTSLYDAAWREDEGRIQIAGEDGQTLSYEADLKDGITLLGQQVEYYSYKKTDVSTDEVLWIAPAEQDQNMIEISTYEISDESNWQEIVYYSGQQIKRLKVAPEVKVIYNYVACPKGEIENIKPEMGSIRAIDYNRNGVYDVICIYDYKGFVVDKPELKGENPKIAVRNNAKNIFSVSVANDEPEKTFIMRDGRQIAPEELKAGDIICVAQSKNSETRVILAEGEVVSGGVQRVREKNERSYLTVDGKEYVASSMLSVIPQPSDQGDFYVTQGAVVFVDYNITAAENYAYLLDATRKGSSFVSSYLIKCLTKEGKIVTYELSDRVRIARGAESPETYSNNAAKLHELLQKNKNELVILEFAGDEQVKQVTLPLDNTMVPDYQGYTEDVFSKDKSGNMYFRSINPPTLGGEYMLIKDTIVFDVKSMTPGGEPIEEEDYYAGDYSVFGNDRTYIVDVYDASPNLKAGAVVIRSDISTEEIVPYNSSCFLVDGLETGLDGEGVPTVILSGLYEGEETRIVLEDEKVADTETDKRLIDVMESGAVLQIKKNMKGELEAARILYLPSDDSYRREMVWSGSGSKVDLYTTYGMVRYLESDVLSISTDGGVTAKPFAVGNARIYRVNTRRERIGPGEIEDITAARTDIEGASCVFVRTYRNEIGEIIIFE